MLWLFYLKENVRDFVAKYTQYLMYTSVKDEIEDFCLGIKSVVGSVTFDLCTPLELELLFCGSSEIGDFKVRVWDIVRCLVLVLVLSKGMGLFSNRSHVRVCMYLFMH